MSPLLPGVRQVELNDRGQGTGDTEPAVQYPPHMPRAKQLLGEALVRWPFVCPVVTHLRTGPPTTAPSACWADTKTLEGPRASSGRQDLLGRWLGKPRGTDPEGQFSWGGGVAAGEAPQSLSQRRRWRRLGATTQTPSLASSPSHVAFHFGFSRSRSVRASAESE